MKKISFTLLLFFSLTAFSSLNQQPSLVYLSLRSIKVMKVIPPVPARGSAMDQKDIAQLLAYQNSRTAAECDRAAVSEDANLKNFFGPPYGNLTESEIDKLNFFFQKISLDAGSFILIGKTASRRARPYIYHSEITPCIEKETSSAYPSGHATLGKVFALVLADIFPERAENFLKRSKQISEERVLGGVHHPSDTKAGEILGEEIYKKLSVNIKFQRELKKIKENFNR